MDLLLHVNYNNSDAHVGIQNINICVTTKNFVSVVIIIHNMGGNISILNS